MYQGQLVAAGPPADVLTPTRLADIFEVHAEIGLDALGNLAVSYRSTAPQNDFRSPHATVEHAWPPLPATTPWVLD
ncbi:hypothetical protein ABT063_47585 [Streptomyces sp. NPDC002838]|uniref:hypothetical protein n=1 Tax=Streptomyces sp. NPDC002838 TaxID=3154436 RepID=UPI00332ECF6F